MIRRKASGHMTKGEVARERLLQVGERLFSTQPFDTVSIDDISAEAGVAHGLLFHYFKSKTKFYAEISRRISDRLEHLHREARPEATPDAKLAACLAGHIENVRSRPASYKFHTRGGASSEIKQIWEDSRHRFIFLILGDFYGIAEPDVQLVSAMRAWLGFFDELVLASLNAPDMKVSGLIELSVRLFNETLSNYRLLAKDPAALSPAPLPPAMGAEA